jgi:hypothetical protein
LAINERVATRLMSSTGIGRRWLKRFGWVLAACIGAGAVGIAGFRLGERTLRTAPAVPVSAAPITVVASEATLVDERQFTVDAEWTRLAPFTNRLNGTVTSAGVGNSGESFTIASGDVLYSVDDIAVVAIPGVLPAYRSMSAGTVGTDVRQLQEFLVAAGFALNADGRWRSDTTAAYKRWRADHFLPPRSEVVLGEIVFVETLPLLVSGSAELRAGSLITDGDIVLETLGSSPMLQLSLGSDSTLQIPAGTAVNINVAGVDVLAVATERQSQSDSGARLVELTLADPADSCAPWCASVPTVGVSSWPATVRLKGPATGVTVPLGAIRVGEGSGSVVVLESGVTMPVEVVLQVGGDAIVTGIAAGDVVVLPNSGG